MFLSKTFYPLLSTGSTQEDRKSSRHDLKIVEWDVKHQQKQDSSLQAVFAHSPDSNVFILPLMVHQFMSIIIEP